MTSASAFAELHDELRTVARDLLAKGPTPDRRQIADAGWLGLEVADDLDGAGATFAEVAVVLEELGRAVAPVPFLGTAVLGVGTLNLLAPNPLCDALLRRIATGDRTLAVAGIPFRDRDGVPTRHIPVTEPVGFRVERSADGARLHGTAALVVDAPDADRFLLLADDPDGPDAGPVVVVVHGPDEVPDLTVTPQPLLDATRRVGTVTVDGVAVNEAAVWRFAGDPQAAVRTLHDRAALAVALDSLGVSEAMLAATVAYAGHRHQFGRPIGSFQAVKHACADMLVQVSVARRLVTTAVEAVAAGAPDADRAVAMAKSYATQAAVDVVGKALQLHGGIGYTWESGIHVHLKRAALNRSLFGSPRDHRRRLVPRYLAVAPT
jgi:alkylation response protein AidB-like acyl-CoA dehydrogenase